MKNLPFIIGIILALWLGFSVGQCTGSRSSPIEGDVAVYRDTIVDTITYRQPVPVDSVVLCYVTVKLPQVDTILTKGEDIIKVDSVYVEVPIQQK